MALKLKKENEGLKASLAKAEQVCLTHMACMCLTHTESLAKAECV